MAKIKSTIQGCAIAGCGCFALTALVIIVSASIFHGCGNTKQATAVKKAVLTQKERLAKRQEQVVEEKTAQKEAAQKARYEKAYAKFEQYVLSLSGVQRTQRFSDNSFRVYITCYTLLNPYHFAKSVSY